MSAELTGLTTRVDVLEKEQIRMGMEQKRTNEILTEFRDDVKSAFKWLFSLMATAIFASVMALVLKSVQPDPPAPQSLQVTTTTRSP